MLYPLRFEPLFRRYLWGGRRLATVLDKPIGNNSCAESWEIVDHNQDQSAVAFGDLKGKKLNELIDTYGEQLLGSSVLKRIHAPDVPDKLKGRVPLLFKFLDAHQNLSVQVHPDDAIGATLEPPDFGKTEAWYVMHAEAGSKIYAGLKNGVSDSDLRAAINNGTTEELLNCIEPKPGDCIFIRAGTMHAIGAGLLIAEIQQASDTTYRVFDWNRVNKDGKPRELHIEESLKATDFDLGPVQPSIPQPTEFANATTLIANDKFVMRRWQIDSPIDFDDEKLHFLAVTKGSVHVTDDPCDQPLATGNTMLIPACQTQFKVTPNQPSEILDIVLPY